MFRDKDPLTRCFARPVRLPRRSHVSDDGTTGAGADRGILDVPSAFLSLLAIRATSPLQSTSRELEWLITISPATHPVRIRQSPLPRREPARPALQRTSCRPGRSPTGTATGAVSAAARSGVPLDEWLLRQNGGGDDRPNSNRRKDRAAADDPATARVDCRARPATSTGRTGGRGVHCAGGRGPPDRRVEAYRRAGSRGGPCLPSARGRLTARSSARPTPVLCLTPARHSD